MTGGTAPGAPGTADLLEWPLVGRHAELEAMMHSLADPEVRGLVIHGPAGVGKSRLAEECASSATRNGRVAVRAAGTERARNVPLGALVHLLPLGIVGGDRDPIAVFPDVIRAIRTRSPDHPLIVLIDDLPLLDVTSVTLMGELLDAGRVFLIGTVRTGETVPKAVAELYGNERIRRIDLLDLSHDALDTLLHLALGGPVDVAVINEVWDASQGNVLFVRELMMGALASGHLVNQRGVWRLSAPLVATARLIEVVEERIGALDPQAREALDFLSLWEPVGLATLESIAGPEVIEALDRSGLLMLRTDIRRQQISLAHPLYGEVLRDRLPALTRRRLLLEHVGRIEGRGARRREDPVHVASARMDATGSADPQLLVAAARLARYSYDFPQVERLARAALIDEMIPEAGLLLGEALHDLARYDEAEEVFARAQEAVPVDDEALLVPMAAMRGRNLMWGLGRPDEALAINRAVRASLTSPTRRDEALADEAFTLSYSGRPLEALELLEDLRDVDDRRTRVIWAIAAEPALNATGQCETVIDLTERAFVDHTALGDHLALAEPGVHFIFRVQALAEAGELAAGIELAEACYRDAARGASAPGAAWFAFSLGRCALLSGRPQTARRWLAESAARFQPGDHGPRRMALSLLATAAAWLGDAAGAQDVVREMDELPPFAFYPADQELGRGWAAAAAGETGRAREVLLAAAQMAAEMGYRTSEAWLLHDVARLGDPGATTDRLDALAAVCEGALVTARAVHAHAMADRNSAALTEAADRFEAMGALLFAAEAATDASHAYQRRGERRTASALMFRATTLAQSCEAARTPGMVTADAVVPLTSRERDVAVLAAQGVTSKEIADRLFLSVRTVSNHLQGAYTKLGVSSRKELADVLADVTDAASSD